jgi:hypothetical protein
MKMQKKARRQRGIIEEPAVPGKPRTVANSGVKPAGLA